LLSWTWRRKNRKKTNTKQCKIKRAQAAHIERHESQERRQKRERERERRERESRGREGERGEVCIATTDGIVCPSGTDGEKTHTRTDWGTDWGRDGRTDGRTEKKEGRKEGEQKTEILFLSPFLSCKRICVKGTHRLRRSFFEWMDDWMHGRKKKGTLTDSTFFLTYATKVSSKTNPKNKNSPK
jgi:hypothetical protein